MTMQRVMTKARKHSPSVATEFLVDVNPGKSIQIFREKNGVITECKSFQVGDQAEYDSYNLSYYGEILAITDNTVTIAHSYGGKKHRLDLNTFCWRNYNWVWAQTQAENHKTMMYI